MTYFNYFYDQLQWYFPSIFGGSESGIEMDAISKDKEKQNRKTEKLIAAPVKNTKISGKMSDTKSNKMSDEINDSEMDRDLTLAVWWYSRASSAGNPLGSTYVGLINHFGIGVSVNIERAVRYYKHAISQSDSVVRLCNDKYLHLFTSCLPLFLCIQLIE